MILLYLSIRNFSYGSQKHGKLSKGRKWRNLEGIKMLSFYKSYAFCHGYLCFECSVIYFPVNLLVSNASPFTNLPFIFYFFMFYFNFIDELHNAEFLEVKEHQ